MQRLFAEGLGTAFLLIGVVGSGIMGETLTDDTALALLANAIATGCILYGAVRLKRMKPANSSSYKSRVA
jgi:glycerol uptake facilitator-like aquaporin